MSALTIKLKSPYPQHIDVSPLTPDKLAGKSLQDIGAILLSLGKRQLPVAELFDLSGDDTSHIIVANSSDRLDHIGAGMQSGQIEVQGDAGHYLGFQMRGGQIEISGNAGDFAASGMAGGRLRIHGNAGDFLGAAIAGERKGMRGGIVIVHGNAGDRLGDQMRRGMILVEGNTGDYCASRMLAGTIGVLGQTGNYTAFAMRRGTLLLQQNPNLHLTLRDCGAHTLPYLSLMFKSFQSLPGKFAALNNNRVQRFAGDIANDGKGEVLVLL